MATESTEPTTADAYEQMFPNWVYQVPGFVLITAGFGGLGLLSVF